MATQHRKNKTIAIDTNMILAVARFKTDIFSQARNLLGSDVEFVIPEKNLEELEKLSRQGKKNEKEIMLALEIMKKNNVKEIDAEGENADKCLEKLAAKGIIIATNDRALRKKIKVFGSNIFLKKKRFIALE
ncbi:MAG: hypothetical protein PHH08_00915 [Candidatus ainarchaeum sp.]|nr:hypothetical protein [Candidatus ainarchaeum sp.]